MMRNLMLGVLVAAVLTAPAAAQDGSGVERERTKATAQDFFTKAVERSKTPIEIDAKQASSTEDFGYNFEFKFPPGRVLGIAPGATDCVSKIKAIYVYQAGPAHLPKGNPMMSVFGRSSGGDIAIGEGFIDWSQVIAVTRTGAAITVKGMWHFRFIFPTEELAQRFGAAMEFMRTQCAPNTDDDLAF